MLELFSQEIGRGLVDSLQKGVDTQTYKDLTEKNFTHHLVDTLNKLDPFSVEYREIAMQIYRDLRGDDVLDYVPNRDEASGMGDHFGDIHRKASPWSFQNPEFISEFLFSWGQIFKHLNVEAGQSVLEYGSGSGQVSLMLARSGIKTFCVDIDYPSLRLLQEQSNDLGIEVKIEREEFGGGFIVNGVPLRFDRILFFEAFHHAIDFEKLLVRLHKRLKPGGRIVFCGEPVVKEANASIPYPWGPRLDALSVFCIRAKGWMELGFQYDTFVELLWRCGYRVYHYPFPLAFRGETFVAEPISDGIDMGSPLELGKDSVGWHAPEGEHRWTKSVASLPMPVAVGSNVDIDVTLSNYLPTAKRVFLSCGDAKSDIYLHSGEIRKVITIHKGNGSTFVIRCKTHGANSHDCRQLGVAVHRVSLSF